MRQCKACGRLYSERDDGQLRGHSWWTKSGEKARCVGGHLRADDLLSVATPAELEVLGDRYRSMMQGPPWARSGR
jgi:hypothetical protein